jgi:hypothetical protein
LGSTEPAALMAASLESDSGHGANTSSGPRPALRAA